MRTLKCEFCASKGQTIHGCLKQGFPWLRTHHPSGGITRFLQVPWDALSPDGCPTAGGRCFSKGLRAHKNGIAKAVAEAGHNANLPSATM